MELRPYQADAVAAVWAHLQERADNPCVVMPTGSGKSPVIGAMVRDAVTLWNGRVLVLAHVKELLEQNADKIRRMAPDIPVGVYSAGLGRRDTAQPVIVAGIQSIHRRACELDRFDLVLIDEAHLIPAEGDGMYRQFLADARIVNPELRVIGLTATPYRLGSGRICGPDNILNHVCYEAGIRDLIAGGYLSPLTSKAGRCKADLSDVGRRGGEFIADQAERIMDADALVRAAVDEVLTDAADRKAVLIFAVGIKHGRHIVQAMADRGVECGFVSGDTPKGERAELLDRFRGSSSGLFGRPPLKYLCNVNVLTTGFDAPHIDCVVLLRPTESKGLYYQMVGRGFRLHPDKTNCLVLDFAGNILRHGPVDCLEGEERSRRGSGEGAAPGKECPKCREVVGTSTRTCPSCGYEWPEQPKHAAQASRDGVLSGEITDEEFDVLDIAYTVHHKRGDDDAPPTLRVAYRVAFETYRYEWVCFGHAGFARERAEAWWARRCDEPVPATAADAAAMSHMLRPATRITVRKISGQKFPRIIKYVLGPSPKARWDDAPTPERELEPHVVLGVPAHADFDTIRTAYRKLVLTVHPDKGGSHEAFVRVEKAYRAMTEDLVPF